eukprot:6173815-Pleurochrysis_carterae.AAC.1
MAMYQKLVNHCRCGQSVHARACVRVSAWVSVGERVSVFESASPCTGTHAHMFTWHLTTARASALSRCALRLASSPARRNSLLWPSLYSAA